MSQPRNRKAYEQGQVALREVRTFLHARPPGALVTWKHVAAHLQRTLGRELKKWQICAYMRVVRQADRSHPNTTPGVLHPAATLAHADTHGSSSPVTTLDAAAPGLLARGNRDVDGPVAPLVVPTHGGGPTGNRTARPPPVGPSRGSIAPRVPDRLEGYVARDIRERRFIEPDEL